jgi:hypothetical protein
MKQVSQEIMDAMKKLLNSYKTKDGLTHCPLCVVAKKMVAGSFNCSACPWMLFGYKGQSNGNSYACDRWINENSSSNEYITIIQVRNHPADYDKYRKKRIGMLVQWIRNSEVV